IVSQGYGQKSEQNLGIGKGNNKSYEKGGEGYNNPISQIRKVLCQRHLKVHHLIPLSFDLLLAVFPYPLFVLLLVLLFLPLLSSLQLVLPPLPPPLLPQPHLSLQ